MADELEDLQARVRRLPPADRARLAEELLDSLQAPIADVQAAWQAEVQRRVEALGRGETATYAADEVFAEAKRLLR